MSVRKYEVRLNTKCCTMFYKNENEYILIWNILELSWLLVLNVMLQDSLKEDNSTFYLAE